MKVFAPFTSSLNSHVLLGWHKLIDNQMLQADFPSQFSDAVHQVFTLSVDRLGDVVEVALGLAVLPLHLVDLLAFHLQFVLFAREILVQVDLEVLLGLQLLLQLQLFAAAFFKLSPRF